MPSSSTRSNPASGLTLIELLVALGIGALVMAVLVLAYHAITGVSHRQDDRGREQEYVSRTFGFFREDLQNLFFPATDQSCAITLEQTVTNLTALTFCRWENTAIGGPLATNRLQRVTFAFASQDGTTQLVRIDEALTGPDALRPPVTNWPGRTWPSVRIEFYDGFTWLDAWPEDAKTAPAAARIQLLDNSTPPVPAHEDLVLIPAGLSVTSRMIRSTTP